MAEVEQPQPADEVVEESHGQQVARNGDGTERMTDSEGTSCKGSAPAPPAVERDFLQRRADNIRQHAGDSPDKEMDGVREALKGIEARRASESTAVGGNALELYNLRDMLREEQRLRREAEAAPRIAEDRVLAAEERAYAAEVEREEAEEARKTAILECRRDRRSAAELNERVREDAAKQIRDAAQLVAAAEADRDEKVAAARAESEARITEIRARALDDAREEVKAELEEARLDAATAEAQSDDIREELERMQADGAAALAASQQQVQSLHRECKALNGRIAAMESETRQKVLDACAMEASKSAKRIAELQDASIMSQAAAKKAQDRAAKAEKKVEKLKQAQQEAAMAPSSPTGHQEQASRSRPVSSRPTSTATEKRASRAQEEVKALRLELNAVTTEHRSLQLEFLNRERSIRLAAADEVDTAKDEAAKALQKVAQMHAALSLAVTELLGVGQVVPPEIQDALRPISALRRRPDTSRTSDGAADKGRAAHMSSAVERGAPQSGTAHLHRDEQPVTVELWMLSSSEAPPNGKNGFPPEVEQTKTGSPSSLRQAQPQISTSSAVQPPKPKKLPTQAQPTSEQVATQVGHVHSMYPIFDSPHIIVIHRSSIERLFCGSGVLFQALWSAGEAWEVSGIIAPSVSNISRSSITKRL